MFGKIMAKNTQKKVETKDAKEADEHRDLWKKYRAGDRHAYEQLVESYLPMVKITVGRVAINIPTYIDREELYSAGCVGLLSALERYDPEREAKFTTYAMTRIRGSIIDELRQHDMLGRVTRDRVNRIGLAAQELQNQGVEAGDEEIAEQAGLTMDEYWDAEAGKQATRMVSLNNTSNNENDEDAAFAELLAIKKRNTNPGHAIETAEIIELIYSMLDEKEQLLVVLYYNEELTLKEVGVVMEVSESRVCQMHTAMVAKIKKNMNKRGIYM